MATDNDEVRIINAVKAAMASLPPRPKVEGVMLELDTDEAGDPAVFITMILADRTPDSDWVTSKLEPIAEQVREAVRGSGAGRYPYVRFARSADVPKAGGFDAEERVWRRVG